jgi:hypothetical protein
MKKLLAVVFLCSLLLGCGTERSDIEADSGAETVVKAAKTLALKWERFASGQSEACQRCQGTRVEIQKAFQRLQADLAPVGIDVTLDEGMLSKDEAAADMCQSNRIWIEDKPLETWLGGEVGKSRCEGCCEAMGSEVMCRTMIYEGETYEAIPANLIVKAAYAAASRMLGRDIKPCDSGSGICTCGTGAPCPGAEGGGHVCAHQAGAASLGSETECSATCSGEEVGCGASCPGKAAAQPKKATCPRSKSCTSTTCPAGG